MKMLNVRYEYEKEGYDLGNLGWYLPDFWLPDHNSWLEIKGQPPTANEIDKCKALALGTMKVVYLSCATVPSSSDILADGLEPIHQYSPALFMGEQRKWIEYGTAVWCCCPNCGVVGLANSGDGMDLSRQGLCCCSFDPYKTVTTYDNIIMLHCYNEAREARFDSPNWYEHPRAWLEGSEQVEAVSGDKVPF